MKIAKLNDIIMCSSNVLGSTYDEWASGTTYATNDHVVVSRSSDGLTEYTPHEEYISLADSNVGNYPPDSPTEWSLVGTSNRWKMFDGYVNTQTVTSAQDLEAIIDASKANIIALFSMYGTQLSLTTLGSNLTTSPRCTTDAWTKNGFSYDSTNDWYSAELLSTDIYLYQSIGTLTEGHTYKVVFTARTDRVNGTVMHVELKGTSSGSITTIEGRNSYEVDIVAGSSTNFIYFYSDIQDAGNYVYLDNIYVFDTIGTPHTVDLVDAAMNDEWIQFFGNNSYRKDYGYAFTFAVEEYIKIKITQKSSATKCGMVAIGSAVDLGLTQWEPHIGIDDYSKKGTDSLGRTYLSQGSWSKIMVVDFWLDSANVDLVRRAFAEIRGVAIIADANGSTTSYESLLVYGFWQNFDIIIPGPIKSKCSLEFKGLI